MSEERVGISGDGCEERVGISGAMMVVNNMNSKENMVRAGSTSFGVLGEKFK